METKHTPGPWSPWGKADPSQVIASENGFVAQTVGGNDEANARLIAAAPELLNALTLVKAHLSEPECAIWRHVHSVMDDAIAKATGTC